MSYKCPSCSADVPGVVLQSTLEERLNAQRAAKEGEIALLRDQLGEASDKASRFDGVESERARLAGELVRLNEGSVRRAALVELGIHDPAVHSTFGVLYDSAVAGISDDERPAFADWLGDESGARLNPVLAPMFAAPESGAGSPVSAPAVSRPVVGFPPPAQNAKPGTPSQDPKVDAGQIRRMLQGMTVEEVAAWQQQHGERYGWAPVASASSSA